jgi:uncharacterized delta-60 repeat protein
MRSWRLLWSTLPTCREYQARYQRAPQSLLHVERLEARLAPSAGDLDVVFGGTGKITTDFHTGSDQLQAIAVQANGQIVAAGTTGGTVSDMALARYNRNGSLDAGFGNGGKVVVSAAGLASAARGVVIQPDGKIVVAGSAGPAGSEQFVVTRFNADGSLDPSFGSGGTTLTGFGAEASASGLALQADGKIVVAGFFQPGANSSASDFALARYTVNGALDPTFGTGGKLTTKVGDFDAAANQVLVQADGKIVAAGHTSTSGGGFKFALVRYNNDGSLDTTFNGTGIVTINFGQLDDIHGLALQPDSKLVAVGSYFTGSKVDLALARYNPDGSLDASFGTGGKVTTDLGGQNQSAQSAVIQADGKLVVAGVYAPKAASEFFLARYRSDGTLDANFGTNGLVLTAFDPSANGGAAGLVQLADGTFVAGGTATDHFALARYWGDNSPPSYALGSPNAVFVAMVYRQLLGRAVDAGGLPGWVNALSQGASRAQVMQAIEQSAEYRTRLVDSLYLQLLHRTSDAGGEAGFVAALGAGMTIEQVKAIILGSPEYLAKAGGTDAAFLQAIYHDVLSRPMDSAGGASWEAAMGGGMSPAQVAFLITTSTEARQDLIAADYQQYLQRPADPGGLAGWLGALSRGLRDEALLAGLIGSQEYFDQL